MALSSAIDVVNGEKQFFVFSAATALTSIVSKYFPL